MNQLELGIQREREKDRNFHLGGRSFYFFDFDDNVAFLTTSIFIFHKKTGIELALSSGEYAREHSFIGKSGIYADYEFRYDEKAGSFRSFRDHDESELKALNKKEQIFISDLAHALGFSEFQWQGPSWNCFYHATFNQRPMSLITARGHAPETIKAGIELLRTRGLLAASPNYLSVFPVSHNPTRKDLGDLDLKATIPELKKRAIRKSVELAIEKYGESPHHRFGMSDDDPKNIELIVEEMKSLKVTYPEMSFFMIETHGGAFIKHEVSVSGLKSEYLHSAPVQTTLFQT